MYSNIYIYIVTYTISYITYYHVTMYVCVFPVMYNPLNPRTATH